MSTPPQTSPLADQHVLLGVTGSIAAYKAADLTSLMRQAGATVHVVMTAAARRFITPLTLQTLSRQPVHTDQFDESRWEPEHTALADRADLLVVAPATANVIAKLAYGLADDLLTTLALAARCPILVAPAMNVHMYENAVVQHNLGTLRSRGVLIADPDHGMLACGYEGQGRLRSVNALFADVERAALMSRRRCGEGTLGGRRVVVTAGPTREPLDPVRVLTNRSSGKMGYAIAQAAALRGATVSLISGPTNLAAPDGVRRVSVETAREMHAATLEAATDADVVIFNAAVADYEATDVATEKIKKSADVLTLELRKTPDIAGDLGGSKGTRFLVGFAAETEKLLEHGADKLRAKNLDLIAVNDVSRPESGLGSDMNRITLLDSDGVVADLPLLPKPELAELLVDAVVDRLQARTASPETDPQSS